MPASRWLCLLDSCAGECRVQGSCLGSRRSLGNRGPMDGWGSEQWHLLREEAQSCDPGVKPGSTSEVTGQEGDRKPVQKGRRREVAKKPHLLMGQEQRGRGRSAGPLCGSSERYLLGGRQQISPLF